MIDAAFALTPTVEILASVRVENEASQTRAREVRVRASSARACRARRRAAAWSNATASASPARIGQAPSALRREAAADLARAS